MKATPEERARLMQASAFSKIRISLQKVFFFKPPQKNEIN
jgi:hypothetical protein